MKKKFIPTRYKHYTEYILLRFIRLILLCMPVDMASYLMGKAWRIIAPFNKRHQRAIRHMEWALGDDSTPIEREKIARAMWENIGRTFCEGLISDRILKNPKRIIADSETFRHWNEECKDGALLLTHHFGNWELSSAPAVLYSDHKILGVYKSIRNPLVEGFFLKLRKPLFPGGIYSQQDGAAKKSIEKIRNGIDMAMVCDLRFNRGTPIKFFNMPFPVSSFPETLAIKYKKPVFAAQLRRVKGAHFALDMKQIHYEVTGNLKIDNRNLTQALHSQFELWIRENPEQWMWAPYRWTHRLQPIKKPMSLK
ncbi:MAG: hypothetical protein ABJN78_10070 [Hyphomicrobiales bacterium]